MPKYEASNFIGKEGGYLHLYEIQVAHNTILKESHILELECLKEDGFLTADRAKDAINGLVYNYKQLMNSIYDRIEDSLSIFKGRHSSFCNDKAFLKSVSNYAIKNSKGQFRIALRNFAPLDPYAKKLPKIITDVCKRLDAMEPNLTSEVIYGMLATVNKPISLDTMQKTVYVNCYGAVEEFKNKDLKKWIEYLKNFNDDIDRLEDTKSVIKKQINIITSRLDGYAKLPKNGSAEDFTAIANNALEYCTMAKNTMEAFTMVFNIVMQAYHNRAKNAKQMCLKCMYDPHVEDTGLSKESIEDIYRKYKGVGNQSKYDVY